MVRKDQGNQNTKDKKIGVQESFGENDRKNVFESRHATNSRILGTGKGKPAGNLGSTLSGPCPHLLCFLKSTVPAFSSFCDLVRSGNLGVSQTLGVPKHGCSKPWLFAIFALLHSFALFCALLRACVYALLCAFALFCAYLRVSASNCV